MDIHLKDRDISQMPEPLRRAFLEWVPGHLAKKPQPTAAIGQPNGKLQPSCSPVQLSFNLKPELPDNNSHVRLSQLMDAGFIKPGMPVRVRYTNDRAKESNRDYINNLEISPKGTIIYQGQEFDKPSPLAAKVNQCPLNGWDYVQVKKNGNWVFLKEVRNMWRKSNG